MNFVIRQAAREDILGQYRYYLIEKNAEPAAERFIVAVQANLQEAGTRTAQTTKESIPVRAAL